MALFALLWVKGLVRRRGLRLAGMVVCVALAVALLGSLGMFFAFSNSRMTRAAIAGVPVDWQIQLAPGTDVGQAQTAIAKAPGIAAEQIVAFADVAYLKSEAGGTVQTTGRAKVVGIPDGYQSTFPAEIRPLVGASGGVLLAQQTAANLQAEPGTVVSIGRPGLSARGTDCSTPSGRRSPGRRTSRCMRVFLTTSRMIPGRPSPGSPPGPGTSRPH